MQNVSESRAGEDRELVDNSNPLLSKLIRFGVYCPLVASLKDLFLYFACLIVSKTRKKKKTIKPHIILFYFFEEKKKTTYEWFSYLIKLIPDELNRLIHWLGWEIILQCYGKTEKGLDRETWIVSDLFPNLRMRRLTKVNN